MTPSEFIHVLEPYARKAQQRYGIPWNVLIAQAALETGWLTHPTKDNKTGRDSHNLFNIKADPSWDGPTVTVTTHEYVKGIKQRVDAKFRAYPTYGEAFSDYARLVVSNQRYAKAMAHIKDPIRYIHELAAAGYATDPKYADKVCQIMAKHITG